MERCDGWGKAKHLPQIDNVESAPTNKAFFNATQYYLLMSRLLAVAVVMIQYLQFLLPLHKDYLDMTVRGRQLLTARYGMSMNPLDFAKDTLY